MNTRLTLAGLLFLALAVPQPAAARGYAVVDIVGDSVSAGVNPDFYPVIHSYGWVHALYGDTTFTNPPTHLNVTNLWPSIVAFNSAVSGSTAAQWADPHTAPFVTTVLGHRPDLVLLMLGGNDFFRYAGDGTITEAEMAEYRDNLTAIIGELRSGPLLPDIVIVGYYDLFDGYSTNPILPLVYHPMSEASFRADRAVRDIAVSNRCFYVSTYDHFLHHGYGDELGDPHPLHPNYFPQPMTLPVVEIHPVSAGHEAIAEQVYLRLVELEQIPRILSADRTPEGITLRWSSSIGQLYVVERGTDVALPSVFGGVWTNVGRPPRNSHTDAWEHRSGGFYRIRGRDMQTEGRGASP